MISFKIFTFVGVITGSIVDIAVQPNFKCDRRCMANIGTLAKYTLKNLDINTHMEHLEGEHEAHNREVETHKRGRRSAEDSDALCLMTTTQIPWKGFIEQHLCKNIKIQLPECRNRRGDCITCFGNGTFGKSKK